MIMKISIACFLCTCMVTGILYGQDTLIMKSGSEIYCKITEIGISKVSYKKQDNLQGPIYTITIDKIFMLLFPGGKRELFNKPGAGIDPRPLNQKNNPNGIDSIGDGIFQATLLESRLSRDRKNAIVIEAAVDVYLQGKAFTKVTVNIYQRADVSTPYQGQIKNGYLEYNSISFMASGSILNLLYEKYESVNGKGYGWALPPDFLGTGNGSCSIAFVSQKEANKEIGWGGLSTVRYSLQDCSSPEKKILSATLIWLRVNFEK